MPDVYIILYSKLAASYNTAGQTPPLHPQYLTVFHIRNLQHFINQQLLLIKTGQQYGGVVACIAISNVPLISYYI